MTLPTVTQAPQLPEYLMSFSDLSLSINSSITGGIVSGGHPSIGIKQAKWRLKEGANEELVNSFVLNVIIVDANKNMSKIFYDTKYNPKSDEIVPPACFSDNGCGPSIQSVKPQCATCAKCPKNIWGSRITEQGNKTKACADYKKIAVVLADSPERNVYELRIPPASLQELNKIMAKLIANNIPIPTIVFQLSFDETVEYPKILFKPTGYISRDQAEAIKKWLGSNEAKEAVGNNDVPVKELPVVEAEKEQPIMPVLEEPVKEQPIKRRGRPARATEPVIESTHLGLNLDTPNEKAAAAATNIDPQKSDEALDNLLAGIMNNV